MITLETQSNIVSGKVLRKIQSQILTNLKNAVLNSMGPAGSNTLILKGADSASLIAQYSKDGNRIIKNISYSNPIEMSIQSEISDITRQVERVVGDGTSTAVVLSSIIFDKLLEYIEDNNINNPYKVIRDFQTAVKDISKVIRCGRRECKLKDIYDITYISTNGNEELANTMRELYDQYGLRVYIDVNSSTDEKSYIKEYDGVSFESGYADSAYINNEDGTARIAGNQFSSNVRVYYFADAVDNRIMSSYMQKIINENITSKIKTGEFIPTVIVTPKIGRDMEGFMRQLVSYLYKFTKDMYSQKPPISIVTNFGGLDKTHIDNIMVLCGAPVIQTYIDDEQLKEDQESGIAPSLDNVHEFYGECAIVESDLNRTRFIDPIKMYERDPFHESQKYYDEHGEPVPTKEYLSILNFIDAELKRAQETGEHPGLIGSLKRQKNALQRNMIEYFVGGITISDRESLRDLLEDAVLSCRSAAEHGVGYGVGLEAYNGVKSLLSGAENNYDDDIVKIFDIIKDAYLSYMKLLYSTALGNEKAEEIVNSIDKVPYNISTGEYDGKVITSIETDPVILDTISRIVTIMLTANQALVQSPNVNIYTTYEA